MKNAELLVATDRDKTIIIQDLEVKKATVEFEALGVNLNVSSDKALTYHEINVTATTAKKLIRLLAENLKLKTIPDEEYRSLVESKKKLAKLEAARAKAVQPRKR